MENIFPQSSHHDPHSLPFHELPKSGPSCQVTLLHTGWLHSTREYWADDAWDKDERRRAAKKNAPVSLPICCALIKHGDDYYTWDLGFDPKNERLPKILGEPELPQSATAAELISKHGFDPASLKGIIWSHCHVDHYGNLDDYPTHVPVYVGEGSLSWLNGGDEAEGGLASFPSHFLTGGWKYTEIGASNKQFKKTSIGPFEEAWDFFGDGSAYIIKAEGHCPGHLCLLVRVNDNGDWALLAGDAAHSQSLYWPAPPAPYSVEKDLRSVPGKFKFSPDATTYSCMQDFPEKAFRTLSSLTRLEMEKNVIVLPAHEIEATNAVNLKLGGTYNLSEYGRDGLKKMKADLGQKRHDELQKL